MSRGRLASRSWISLGLQGLWWILEGESTDHITTRACIDGVACSSKPAATYSTWYREHRPHLGLSAEGPRPMCAKEGRRQVPLPGSSQGRAGPEELRSAGAGPASG